MARLPDPVAPRALRSARHHRSDRRPPRRFRGVGGTGDEPRRPPVSGRAPGPAAGARDSRAGRAAAGRPRLRRHRGRPRRAGREPQVHQPPEGIGGSLRRGRPARDGARAARADRGRAEGLPPGGRRGPRRAPSGRAAGAHRPLRRAQAGRRPPRLRRPPHRGAQPRARLRRGPHRLPAPVHPHLRRRVPGHRSAAGRDTPAARRRRSGRAGLAPGAAGAGEAVHRRRSQAVDLPVPAGRRRGLLGGQAPARGGRGARHRPHHQLPRRARHPAPREPRVRAGDVRLRPAAGRRRRGPAPRGRAQWRGARLRPLAHRQRSPPGRLRAAVSAPGRPGAAARRRRAARPPPLRPVAGHRLRHRWLAARRGRCVRPLARRRERLAGDGTAVARRGRGRRLRAGGGPGGGAARVHPVPALRELRQGHDPPVRRRPRGAGPAASPRGRPGLPRPGGSDDDAGRPRRRRAPGRRALRLRHPEGVAVRDRGRGPARVPPAVRAVAPLPRSRRARGRRRRRRRPARAAGADRRGAGGAEGRPPAAEPRAGGGDRRPAARGHPRPRRLRHAAGGRAGPRQRAPRRGAGPALRGGRRALVPRVRRAARERGPGRAGGGGVDPRGGQRRGAHHDRAPGQGARVPGGGPRRSDLPSPPQDGGPLHRPGPRAVRAAARRVAAPGPPRPRGRGGGAGPPGGHPARLRRGHARPRPAGGACRRRRAVRGGMARSAQPRRLSPARGAPRPGPRPRLPAVRPRQRARAGGGRPRRPRHRRAGRVPLRRGRGGGRRGVVSRSRRGPCLRPRPRSRRRRPCLGRAAPLGRTRP